MTLSIHHIAINANDPVKIAALYQRAVGFSGVATMDSVQWIASPNGFIALHPTRMITAQDSPRVCDPGIGHFCIQSGNSDGTWGDLTDNGISFSSKPAPLGTGILYAYGRDPETNLIELEVVPDEAPTTRPWMGHIALVSSDLDRLAAFYARLIGRTCHREGTFANPAFKLITGYDDVKVSAKWIMADNMIFEMWQYLNPPTLGVRVAETNAPGYRHVGFACANLAQESERIEAAGISVTMTQPIDGLPCAAGADPDGNRFIIVEAVSGDHVLSLSNLAAPGFVSDRMRSA